MFKKNKKSWNAWNEAKCLNYQQEFWAIFYRQQPTRMYMIMVMCSDQRPGALGLWSERV